MKGIPEPTGRISVGPLWAFLLLLTVLSLLAFDSWLKDRIEAARKDWEEQEREQMRLILYKVVRFSAPETFFPFATRRILGNLRKRILLRQAFLPLKVFLKDRLEILLFTPSGERLTVPGFSRERSAVSERVLDRIRNPDPQKIGPARSLSGSFFGIRMALERISATPRSFIRLKGSPRYDYAAWFPISKAKACLDRKGTPVPLGHMLILLRKGALEEYELFQKTVSQVSSQVEGRYRLKTGFIPGARRDGGSAFRMGYLRESASTLSRKKDIQEEVVWKRKIRIRLERDGEPDGPTRRELGVLGTGRALGWASMLLFLAGMGRSLLVSGPRDISLRRLIVFALLAATIPTLTVFAARGIDYAGTSRRSLEFSTHRDLERALSEIDLGMQTWQDSVESRLREFVRGLEGRNGGPAESDKTASGTTDSGTTASGTTASGTTASKMMRATPPLRPPQASVSGTPPLRDPQASFSGTLPPPNIITYAYILDDGGNLLEAVREGADRKREQRAFAATLLLNLLGAAENHSPKTSSEKGTMDLSYIHGLSRYLLENLDRIIAFEGFGFRRSLFLSFFPEHEPHDGANVPEKPGWRSPRGHRGPKSRVRFFSAFLNMENLLSEYIRKLISRRRQGMWFGLAEGGEAGPLWSRPEGLLANNDLLTMCEQVIRRNHSVDAIIDLPPRGRFLVTAVPANRMGRFVLFGAVPYEPLARRTSRILTSFGSAVILMLIFGAATAFLLGNRLVRSIERISGALMMIRRGEFELPPLPESGQLEKIYTGVARSGETLSRVYSALPVRKALVAEGMIESGGWRLTARYIPGGSFGGNMSDMVKLKDGEILFCLGGGSGGSIPATLMAARVKMAFSILTDRVRKPGEILDLLNRMLSRDPAKNRRMTLFIGWARTDGTLHHANAGHLWPCFHSAKGPRWLEQPSSPLGSRLRGQSSEQSLSLASGEALVLYSKGWITALDPTGKGDGYIHFADAVERASSDPHGILPGELSAQAGGQGGGSGTPDERSLLILSRSGKV